jgi:hypothetical protein
MEQQARVVALRGHCSIWEDGPETIDPEAEEEGQGRQSLKRVPHKHEQLGTNKEGRKAWI